MLQVHAPCPKFRRTWDRARKGITLRRRRTNSCKWLYRRQDFGRIRANASLSIPLCSVRICMTSLGHHISPFTPVPHECILHPPHALNPRNSFDLRTFLRGAVSSHRLHPAPVLIARFLHPQICAYTDLHAPSIADPLHQPLRFRSYYALIT
ncbi:hypothetical protein EXIGLDRAFT_435570 [Exidia glandulosa HHB12029]|uniref:Uncharacterized protein n=1 Tax=Exidia glandulosa HHB12029 TaxID=1314781 RepID=A0A165KG12_EXIGL|nr:hypothetical protein EXIGLDRAFT_435570 [Exidia glandulosa HHB12029]